MKKKEPKDTAATTIAIKEDDNESIISSQSFETNFASLGNPTRTRWVIRLLVTTVATVLCLYQMYLVVVLYFGYPTTVDIRLDQSPFVQLPSVTVCSDLAATVKVRELSKISPEVHRIFNGKAV